LATLKTFLTVCRVSEDDWPRWVRAWERARGTGAGRPPGAVRARDADPRLLGVLQAIEVDGAEGKLPAYVPRDIDSDPRGIRAVLAEAAEDSGFMVLVGPSSVGKTRSLYQAMLDLMPDWWLVQPQRADELDALTGEDLERVVVWLDDLGRFLGEAGGLTGGTVRRLLRSRQVVLLGTLRPTRYRRYVGMDAPEAHAVERDLLGMATMVRVPERFSDAELGRACELARSDVRVRAALEIPDFGLTQVIAAAPQVMASWQDADVYARALLTAAIDATLLGVRSPMPIDLLRDIAPTYCPERERAEAATGWFEGALEYTTTRLHGGMSLLVPVPAPDGDMGQRAGYTVAEYLLQQTEAERAGAPVPAELWKVCLDHVANPVDLTRLGESAESRREYAHADRFYRTAAAGEPRAAYRLAGLLAASGRDDEALEVLLPWTATPDTDVAEFVARLLGRTGRDKDLRDRAAAGDSAAASELVDLLMSLGRESELRAYGDAGNKAIAYRLAELLTQRGRTSEAAEVLRPHVSSGDWAAADQLTGLYLAAERTDDALDVLREYAADGHHLAGARLAVLLAGLGRETELRARADAAEWPAAVQLADMLAAAGREAELAERADAGDRPAAYRLAHLLRTAEREGELRARADSGDRPAVYQLSDLLAEATRHDEAIQLLRPHADSGDESAVSRLIGLLGRYGDE
jgi:hypothetical protein